MNVNSEMRGAITHGATVQELRQALTKTDFVPMIKSGDILIEKGITTVEELFSALGGIE